MWEVKIFEELMEVSQAIKEKLHVRYVQTQAKW